MTNEESTAVLVVGGGLVGLSAAVFLSWHGLRPVLVERRHACTTHPRSRGVNPRTMELFREVGLDEQIRATRSARALAGNSGVIVAESLAGRRIGALDQPYFGDATADYSGVSRARWCICDQDELEPLLRQRAEALGADVRFGHELVDLHQTHDEVRATVQDHVADRRYEIGASYVVCADGADGGMRHRFGLSQTGVGALAHFMNVEFEAELSGLPGDRRFIMCYVTGAGVRCALMPVDNDRRWMLHVQYQPGEEDAFTPERCEELVRAAVGVPDLPVTIRNVLPWESAGRTATTWRRGRAFLAGDAAHVMPPTGAFGSNTGVQDAHNLAWKLALVLRGQATEALLDTYEQERRSVAEQTVEQAVLRAQDRPRLVSRRWSGAMPKAPGIVSDGMVIFQYRYASDAVVLTEHEQPAGPWIRYLDGTPGTRAPVPARDLFGRDFVLVTGRHGADGWTRAAGKAHQHTGLRLAVHVGDIDAYGISPEGMALIRPDGFIAWRVWRQPRDPANALLAVFSRVLYGGPGDIHWLDVTAPAGHLSTR